MDTVTDSFEAKVQPEPTTGCYLWLGFTDRGGYGRVSLGASARALQAHRVAWEREHGPIPDGLHVLHRCDTPSCVNPEHLFLGTHTDNVRDMHAKGRWARPAAAFCKRGHAMSGDNVYVRTDGRGVECRTCRNGHRS